jgi:sialidase-1
MKALLVLLFSAFCAGAAIVGESVAVYEDPRFYSAFPSIVRRADGELLTAFRRAPDRRSFGQKGVSHTDANSYLVLVRSRDDGRTWTREPETIYAHPFGGSQDPCMVQLRDGQILCASYAWAQVADTSPLQKPLATHAGYVFLGGYLMRSVDGGKSWRGPIIPPPCEGEIKLDIFGKAVPAMNRGAMCEGRDGKLYWAVASTSADLPERTSVHLITSADQGETWKYGSVISKDPQIDFNEASVIETPKGDLVVFLRTARLNDETCIARSSDGGKTFVWEKAGFRGHPHQMTRLPDNRVLLVYGYRHQPFGIRARILNSECTDSAGAAEIILREDGGNVDLGYPWAVLLNEKRALVVYYFNKADGVRQIAGTYLDFK